MNFNIEHLLDLIAQFAPNKYLQAILITVMFAVMAKIVDIIMTRFIERLLKRPGSRWMKRSWQFFTGRFLSVSCSLVLRWPPIGWIYLSLLIS
jgi:hypothetical protein